MAIRYPSFGMAKVGRFRRNSAVEDIAVAPVTASTCRITAETHSGTVIFRIEGELDSVTAPELGHALATAIGERAVLLDLSDVSLIDPAGIGTLREVIHSVHQQGGRVAISRPWRVAKPILHLVGAQGFVYLALSTAGALAWLNNSDNYHQVGTVSA